MTVPAPRVDLTSDGEEVAEVSVRVVWPNGAVREFTARWPAGFRMAFGPSDGSARSEPSIAVMFTGNRAEGGVEVHSEGVPPGGG